MKDVKLKFWATSCLKKTRYPSKQCAEEAINRIHKQRDTPLYIYYCNTCMGYHLTHKKMR